MIHFVLRCDKLAYFTNYKAAYKAIETKSKGIYIWSPLKNIKIPKSENTTHPPRILHRWQTFHH